MPLSRRGLRPSLTLPLAAGSPRAGGSAAGRAARPAGGPRQQQPQAQDEHPWSIKTLKVHLTPAGDAARRRRPLPRNQFQQGYQNIPRSSFSPDTQKPTVAEFFVVPNPVKSVHRHRDSEPSHDSSIKTARTKGEFGFRLLSICASHGRELLGSEG